MIRWMAWHLHRRGLIGFSVAGFVISFFYGFAFNSAAGTTAAEHAAFGRAVMLAARQFTFIIPIPVHPETLGGYEQYKWLSGAVAMMAVWAGLAGVGLARGDEARGLTDEWLAGGVSRARLMLARSGAYGIVLAIACLASVIGIAAVAPLIQQDPNVGGELAKGASMTVGLFCCFAIALLVSQLPAERSTATAFGVGALVLLFVVNGIADTIPSASGIGVITPFHWINKTTSAAPGGVFDVGATIGLAVAALVLQVGSVLVFQRRDVGSGLFSWRLPTGPALRTASQNPMLRHPFSEGLWEQRTGLLVWAVATFGLGALMVSVTKAMVESLLTDPTVGQLFQKIMPGSPYTSMLGFAWFGFALLILAGYAVVQVARWADQDCDGRVEMLLSAPVSRTRVVVDRAAEFALASLVIVLAGSVGVVVDLPFSGISIDAGRLFAASALLWPFALAFGGLGVAVASRWPRIAVPFLATFVVVEYFLGDLAPLLNWPDWIANLSLFHLFGNPLVTSTAWGTVTAMLLVFAGGFAVALVLMQRRDVSGA